eukprot:TRINITY_DN1673_c0_g1_i1.p1 TRINITY_DN1673_c0_g1~~TRINITY_DN1673_c0_g1_i1.p1  ORF type:complete len:286 (-),score=57.63 TRINITY_DN1673_c0_g1_i1:44-901(-)
MATAETASVVPQQDEQSKNMFNVEFLNYEEGPRLDLVRAFYKENHTKQTVEYVLKQRKDICETLKKRVMPVWDALMLLKDVVDESDPDTELSQFMHAFQTAEGLREKFPDTDWLHLLGLLHDLGKFLCHPNGYNLPPWTVHGDTFPVGCQFDERNVYAEYFSDNPDTKNQAFAGLGQYKQGCGLDEVLMSFGHDEYMYYVLKNNPLCKLPEEALYLVRYHSFYAYHTKGAYEQLTDEKDKKFYPLLQEFARHDLYTKARLDIDVEELTPYYQALIEKYCPGDYRW